MDEHYIDTLSPPSSADGDNHLPSLSTVAAVAQFAARGFPPYEYQDDEDMDGEHEIDEDHLRGHPETVCIFQFLGLGKRNMEHVN